MILIICILKKYIVSVLALDFHGQKQRCKKIDFRGVQPFPAYDLSTRCFPPQCFRSIFSAEFF